jgi:ADP-ribosylglycohydrolase
VSGTVHAHPSGVKVIRRELVHELGPCTDDAELFALLAEQIATEEIIDVDTVVVDWRDDGCYLAVHTNSYVILRGLRPA